MTRGAGSSHAAELPSDLVFLGLAAMIDPAATGVRETLGRFRDAGIRTVMITCDQSVTAAAVARSLDLATDAKSTVDARALAPIDDETLAGTVERAPIFSRVSPDQKLRIVTTFQARGEIVAILGDGVDEAAALRKADVGVAIGAELLSTQPVMSGATSEKYRNRQSRDGRWEDSPRGVSALS